MTEVTAYAIGTVAGLTGLDPHTIRAWERRYGAVRPERSPRGSRRYNAAAVARLQLLKALVGAGESISEIASLANDALRERLAGLAGLSSPDALAERTHSLRLALLAPSLEGQLRTGSASLGRLQVTLDSVSREDLLVRLPGARPDVVLAELRSLGPEPLRTLEGIHAAASPRLVVLLYDFASGPDLARLTRAGVHLLRGPLRLAQLQQAIEDLLALGVAARPAPGAAKARAFEARSKRVPAAARRFDDTRLAALREVTGAVRCECPSHLATLVTNLVAFERYSLECEDRDDDDAALHRSLAEGSSQIRAELEQLLENVCRYEKIGI
jgi:DNA-binding transcriptional MerR regulator